MNDTGDVEDNMRTMYDQFQAVDAIIQSVSELSSAAADS